MLGAVHQTPGSVPIDTAPYALPGAIPRRLLDEPSFPLGGDDPSSCIEDDDAQRLVSDIAAGGQGAR